jgi:hypothetical protein
MNKLLKVTLLLVLVVGFFGAYRYGAAEDEGRAEGQGPLPPSFDTQVISDGASVKHILEGTYINSGLYESTTSAGVYTPIDSATTVQCPGTSGTCTISADMWAANGNANTTDNENELCLYVDGNPAPNCNYWIGLTPTNNYWTGSSNSQSVSNLSTGAHIVQTYFWSKNGAKVSYYKFNYQVFKP